MFALRLWCYFVIATCVVWYSYLIVVDELIDVILQYVFLCFFFFKQKTEYEIVMWLEFFFFSSRRRHTISWCDWSSERVLFRSPHITLINWYRNINLFAIVYPFRTRLRTRLTLRWRASRRKPWVFGVKDSHFNYRYSCLHAHFCTLHHSLPVWLQCWTERSPTRQLTLNLKLRCNV